MLKNKPARFQCIQAIDLVKTESTAFAEIYRRTNKRFKEKNFGRRIVNMACDVISSQPTPSELKTISCCIQSLLASSKEKSGFFSYSKVFSNSSLETTKRDISFISDSLIMTVIAYYSQLHDWCERELRGIIVFKIISCLELMCSWSEISDKFLLPEENELLIMCDIADLQQYIKQQ